MRVKESFQKKGRGGVRCEFIIKNSKVIRKMLGFTDEIAAYEKNKMNSFISDELRSYEVYAW